MNQPPTNHKLFFLENLNKSGKSSVPSYYVVAIVVVARQKATVDAARQQTVVAVLAAPNRRRHVSRDTVSVPR